MKYVIVDDDATDLDLAVHFASLIPELELAGKFTDPIQAFSALNSAQDIDLLLCDIDMPNLSGMQLVRSLKNPPQIIFLTSHADQAVEGFELEATDYLVKPYGFDRFFKAINRAMERASVQSKQARDFFYIRSEQQFIKIPYNDVLYIEALKDYTRIVTSKHTHLTAVNLKTVGESLPESIFYRPNRSLIVNLNKMETLDPFELKIGGQSLLITETTYKKLQERIVNDSLIKRQL